MEAASAGLLRRSSPRDPFLPLGERAGTYIATVDGARYRTFDDYFRDMITNPRRGGPLP